MYVMAAHEIRSLGASVSGTIDDTYTEADLCDGDPATPVRVDGGSLSFALTFASGTINGLVVANSNFPTATPVDFSGLGTVTMPTVPAGDIRLNGVELLDSPVTASGTTVTASVLSGPAIVGDVLVGLFRQVRSLPTRAGFPHRPFQILPDGEYGGLSYSKGAQARSCGGTIFVDDTSKQVLQDAFDASRENSRPTVIIPFEGVNDAWVVTWQTFNPQHLVADQWFVEVQWQELPRYRWPEVA